MTIGERIKKLRISKDVSQKALADKIRISKQTLYKYENDIITNIPSDKIEAIAVVLGVTPAYIMGWDNIINENIDLYSISNIEPLPKMKKVPLLGTIACGEPILAEENIEDYINMPEDTKGTFALRCKGDSMINARIFDGDIVYIKEEQQVNNGEIAAVLIENEATLKRVYYYPEKNMLILKAENSKYDDFVYTDDELNNIKIMGKAVGFYSRVI